MKWQRVISFTDRSGKTVDILMMDARRFRLCADCYKGLWPKVRKWLAQVELLLLSAETKSKP